MTGHGGFPGPKVRADQSTTQSYAHLVGQDNFQPSPLKCVVVFWALSLIHNGYLRHPCLPAHSHFMATGFHGHGPTSWSQANP